MAEPAAHKPTDAELCARTDRGELRANPKYLREHFLREGRLTETQAVSILEQATEVLSREPNLVDVKSPVTSALG